ncbi:Uncharacterised protein [Klebsiella variicola]|uniref:Uncharacterized protein n=1 Tax=Klebsiella pneumoniae TaxID=573 RepID=A0A486R7V1_KLEPN|nr:hypothetical protein SM62_03068 [Klebsiella variicola]SAX20594.1 Uncharacterised protein [Klebsiella pneumoniae]VGH40496.1 Uncharacterised protein [Klebsiella quasipneumoniae]VGQ15023.1 hypothetical protein SB6094_05161 [Klebsiella quasivariicola]SWV24482.1 Uncharacterised protein [Klebsiella pneumoniae]
MSEVAKPLRSFTTIKIKHYIYGLFVVFTQLRGVTVSEIYRANFEHSSMHIIKVFVDRAVSPRLKLFREDFFFVPHQSPCLAVIHQLLKLHRSDFTSFFKYILSGINYACHR